MASHFMKKGNKKRNKGADTPASKSSSTKERLYVSLGLLAFFAVLLGLATIDGIGAQQRALDAELAHWRKEYHLNDTQVEQIRQIELKFHGNGNPFTSRTSGTVAENEAHLQELSRAMNPSDGEQFLADLRKSHGPR